MSFHKLSFVEFDNLENINLEHYAETNFIESSNLIHDLDTAQCVIVVDDPNTGVFAISATGKSLHIDRQSYINNYISIQEAINHWALIYENDRLVFLNPMLPYMIHPIDDKGIIFCTKILGKKLKSMSPNICFLLQHIGFIFPNDEIDQNKHSIWCRADAIAASNLHTGFCDNVIGGTFANSMVSIPPARKQIVGEQIILPTITDSLQFHAKNLLNIQSHRKSTRDFYNQPISLDELVKLLWLANREVRFVHQDYKKAIPYDTSIKPYANGGGVYELETYTIINECSDVDSGVYRYVSDKHSLERISAYNKVCDIVFESAKNSVGASGICSALVIISARILRVSWKYEGMVISLSLRNSGILLDELYLAAAALKIGGCAVGMGDAVVLSSVIGQSPWREPVLAQFLVGAIK